MSMEIQPQLLHSNPEVAFFIVAHADDWQLFMFPHAYESLSQSARKTILMVLTAGDAGLGEAFWQAREMAALASLRYCLSNERLEREESGFREVQGKSVFYWTSGNCTCYFLRLPDGGLDGKGFGHGSLQQLENGETAGLQTVDTRSTFTKKELGRTLQTLIEVENPHGFNVSLHYQNPYAGDNFDHPDHLATGRLLNNIQAPISAVRFLYSSYACDALALTLDAPQRTLKYHLFQAYQNTLKSLCGYDTLAEDPAQYARWLEKASHVAKAG